MSSTMVGKKGYNSKKKSYTYVGQLQSDYVLLKTVPNFKFCGAKKFEYEPPGFCCNNGSIKLVSHEMPAELQNLYLGTTEECKHFRTYIRKYNNMFAFTSLGVNYDNELAKRNRGIYIFRVQGKMYHFINDLLPPSGRAKNLQLYFYDNDNELANIMACSEKMHESIVKKLMNILRINPYSIFLKSLIDVPNISNYNIALKYDSGLDQRVYNLPTTSEVAGIWVEKETTEVSYAPHIRIYTHSNRSQIVNYYYGCYDPLQYPLLFPYGQSGWNCDIKKIIQPKDTSKRRAFCEHEELLSIRNMYFVDGYLDMKAQNLEKGKRKRDNISVREYYCYKFQMREDETNETLHSRRLFQQYSVDEHIKLETQRLDFF
ncbi:uncharacterized protein [Nicotiana sylvestris]|uniref:Uncharacterized protein LOC104242831 n=1 Tax=Nicotiana sylvestris TaxID=4096 RepID=A0A1U7Y2Q6_NICSY|nr:PREDICTED: uncharacterized protein LOC104242831 [Nicotiana sylvestris]